MIDKTECVSVPLDVFLSYQGNAMLGNVALMIAHEFNNLLVPLMALSDGALFTEDPQQMREALEKVVDHTQRASKIMERFVETTRAKEWEVRAVPVKELVESGLQTTLRAGDKGVALLTRIPDDVSVLAEPDLFVQVIQNLVLNARKAMESAKGALTIEARSERLTTVIEFRDTGAGMSDERLECIRRLFAAENDFEQVLRGRLVGLGLSACALIARRHKATLEVERNDPKGMIFRLRWPAR